jgi:hypothetical protein
VPDPVEEMEVDDVEVEEELYGGQEEEIEDSDEDQDVRERSRRRKTRPAKYTR